MFRNVCLSSPCAQLIAFPSPPCRSLRVTLQYFGRSSLLQILSVIVRICGPEKFSGKVFEAQGAGPDRIQRDLLKIATHGYRFSGISTFPEREFLWCSSVRNASPPPKDRCLIIVNEVRAMGRPFLKERRKTAPSWRYPHSPSLYFGQVPTQIQSLEPDDGFSKNVHSMAMSFMCVVLHGLGATLFST